MNLTVKLSLVRRAVVGRVRREEIVLDGLSMVRLFLEIKVNVRIRVERENQGLLTK